MIKIIHPGVISFEDVCPDCSCIFSYDPEDVTLETVLDNHGVPAAGFFKIECPFCGKTVTIVGESERKLGLCIEKVKRVTT